MVTIQQTHVKDINHTYLFTLDLGIAANITTFARNDSFMPSSEYTRNLDGEQIYSSTLTDGGAHWQS